MRIFHSSNNSSNSIRRLLLTWRFNSNFRSTFRTTIWVSQETLFRYLFVCVFVCLLRNLFVLVKPKKNLQSSLTKGFLFDHRLRAKPPMKTLQVFDESRKRKFSENWIFHWCDKICAVHRLHNKTLLSAKKHWNWSSWSVGVEKKPLIQINNERRNRMKSCLVVGGWKGELDCRRSA